MDERRRLIARAFVGTVTGFLLLGVLAPVGGAATHPRPKRCGSTGPYGQEVDRPGHGDPLLPRQWGLEQIDAPEAWQLGVTGEDVTIALIDTGIDLTHPDLNDNLVGGIDLIPGDGDCPGPQDEIGHGTFTAGILAAEADNGLGVRGVAYDVDVLPIRATTAGPPVYQLEDPGLPQRLAAAIDYAVERGSDVILIEAGVAEGDPNLERVSLAIDRAWRQGAVLVAPAVNSYGAPCFYPASEKHVLCVAATDHMGRPAHYSNLPVSQGEPNAVRAPGGFGWDRGFQGTAGRFCQDEDLWSTVWPKDETWGCDGAAYDSGSGTSFAAPHVAGVAALLTEIGASNGEIVDCITSTAWNPVTNMRGAYDPTYGYGIIDADQAVRCAR